MPESSNKYSFKGLYLPESRTLIVKLKKYSLIVNIAVMSICGIILLGWSFNIDILRNFFIYFNPVPFYTAAVCLLSAVAFFPQISARTNVTLSSTYKIIPVISGAVAFLTGAVGLVSFFTGSSIGNILFSFIDKKSTILVAATIFIAIGFSAIIARANIAHRFHIVQALALLIVAASAIPLIGYIYQLITPFPASNIMFLPPNTALLFLLMGHVMLLRWPNRGFMGMFTLDSLSSVFALRLLVINVVLAPIIGLFVLNTAGRIVNTFNEILAVVVITLMFVSSLLAWINIKLLYKFELEFLLMKEALRVHNIDLKMSNEQMSEKVEDLEKTTKHYQESLNYQDKFRDMADRLG